jgi:hypothetical protein
VTDLTDLEQQILAFEQRRYLRSGVRDQAIKDEFGMSTSRYEQIKNQLIDKPEALVAEPMLVKRLRRLRETRRLRRTS